MDFFKGLWFCIPLLHSHHWLRLPIGGFEWYVDPVPDLELWARWTAVGSVSGQMHEEGEGHGSGAKTNIFKLPNGTSIWRKFVKLRTQLFPYIYTQAHIAHEVRGVAPGCGVCVCLCKLCVYLRAYVLCVYYVRMCCVCTTCVCVVYAPTCVCVVCVPTCVCVVCVPTCTLYHTCRLPW